MKPAVLSLAVLAAAVLALALPGGAHAGAIQPLTGCLTNDLGPADDTSSGAVVLPFTVDYFGVSYNSLYVNNNGNVTFDAPLLAYTPFGISNLHRPLIAPFFADVDTRGFASGTTHYGTTTVGGNDAFCVLWDGVGYYNSHSDPLNRFQLLLVKRPDRGAGDFDIVFNYDQVQWETGDASGGFGGLGGVSAEIGFSNQDQHFELPGSRVPGSFLDVNPTGLIRGNADAPAVPGRYVFHVDNGTPPIGVTVGGNVWDGAPGTPVPAAFVELCPTSAVGVCRTTSTRDDGSFSFLGVGDGTYKLFASPPSLATLADGSTSVNVAGTDLTGQDITVQMPTAMPTGTSVTTPSRGTIADGTPSVFWNDMITLTTSGCTGGTGTATLTAADGFTEFTTLVEGAPGEYSGTLAAPFPHHGHASIAMSITCGTSAAFDVYALPSGNVKTTLGNPLVGATVTLLAADTPAGPFAPVPSGSPFLSPGNRLNPSLSEGGGAFGWDVLSGYYKVRAEMSGCHAPGDPAQPFVESGVLSTQPAVGGTLLTLDCTAPPVDNTTPTITAAGLTAEATGPLTVVNYTFDATDPDDPVAAASCDPAPGATFAVGSTPIHCTATDSHGNTGTADFAVVVSDTTPPVLAVPATIHAEATSATGTSVDYIVSASDLVDGVVQPSCTPPSGHTFALGTTTVDCTAIDSHGNSAAKQFDVVVGDTTAPTLTVPATIHVTASSPAGAVVMYTATADDLVDGPVVPFCMPSSGSTFAIGTTTVTCTAADAHGNSATRTFDVVVAPANLPPTADAGGPYTVEEGSSVTVAASGTDPEGGALTYAWDLNDDGSFETGGQSVSFSAAALDGPATRTISVHVTDNGGLEAVAPTTVDVTNVPPSASFDSPSSVLAGSSFVLSLTGANDPSAADTAAGFTYAFDCGSGYGSFGSSNSATCTSTTAETLAVGARIRDKDGGSRTYTEAIEVGVTFESLNSLTRTLVTKRGVADGLCDKLDSAAAADARGDTATRDGALNAYRNQLDAQTGKSVTAEDAAILESLSRSLQ